VFNLRKYRLVLTSVGVLFFLFVVVILLIPDEFCKLRIEIEGEGSVSPDTLLTFERGTTAQLTAQAKPNSNKIFSHWEGDLSGTDPQISFVVSQSMNIKAVFSEAFPSGLVYHSLNIVASGTGRGTLLPQPGSYFHESGKNLHVEARPEEGSYFAGWFEVSPQTSGIQERTPYYEHSFVLREDTVLIATFLREGYCLEIDRSALGNVAPERGTYALAAGLEWRIWALPEPGCRLKHWENGAGEICHVPLHEDDLSFYVCPVTDGVYRAVFEKAERKFSFNIEEEGKGRGRVIPSFESEEETALIPYGQVISLQAIPLDSDSAFYGWSGRLPKESANTQALAPEIYVAMTEDCQLTAHFGDAQTRLTVESWVEGKAETVAASSLTPAPGSYGFAGDYTTVMLCASLHAHEALAFDHWEGDLPESSDRRAMTLQLPMNKDRHIQAHFIKDETLPLVLSSTGGGSMSPAPGSYHVAQAMHVELKAQASEGFAFGGWHIVRGDGSEVFSIDNPLPLEVKEETQVNLSFGREALWFRVDASDANAETSPPQGLYTIAKGTAATLYAKPLSDKSFQYWMSSHGERYFDNPYVLKEVNEFMSYTAFYGLPLYGLHLSTTGEGVGTVEINEENPSFIIEGSTVTLKAKASPDSVFSHWEGDLSPQSNPLSDELIVIMDKERCVTASFLKADHQLTITTVGLEDCVLPLIMPLPGTHGYRHGAEVDLYAFPPSGGELCFLGWSGDITSIDPQQVLVMDCDRHLIAHFGRAGKEKTAALDLSLPASVDNCYFAPVDPGQYSFLKGTKLSISLVLGQGMFFGGWIGDEEDTIQYTKLDLLLDQDKRLEPRLSTEGGILTLMLDSPVKGSIHPPPGRYYVASGLKTYLTASCNSDDYSFEGWLGADGRRLSQHKKYQITISPSINQEIIAVFRKYREPPTLEFCGLPAAGSNLTCYPFLKKDFGRSSVMKCFIGFNCFQDCNGDMIVPANQNILSL